MLTEFLQSIKRAAVEAVEAGEPAAPFLGTVVSEAPLLVRLNQRLTLPSQRLVLLAHVDRPAVGDRLALLRFAGGQRYLVLGHLR